VGALTVQAASQQEYRTFSVGGVEAAGLQQVRFPYAGVSGRVGATALSYAASFVTYAERTFDLTTSDTAVLRGTPVAMADRNSSLGGAVDIRGALAWRTSPKVTLGVAGHILGGSAQVTSAREFSDSAYRSFTEIVTLDYSGRGFSAGVVALPLPGLRLGASARVDGRLKRRVGSQIVGRVSLPISLAGGFEVTLVPAIRLSGLGIWRSWSRAAADLAPTGTTAFDTWETGWGTEMGRDAVGGGGGPPLPVRLGVRYAKLPFSSSSDQPRELDLTAGTGVTLGGGRVRFDVAVERAMRDGGGTRERAWQLLLGFQLHP
ncbi:MAG: hypothetical protein HY560_03400, partial [Gemmatimonadetes bacterium]|nr:hypothetical protein [Gemmatimonadota bacterium]